MNEFWETVAAVALVLLGLAAEIRLGNLLLCEYRDGMRLVDGPCSSDRGNTRG